MDDDAGWGEEDVDDSRLETVALNNTFGVYYHNGRLTTCIVKPGTSEDTTRSLSGRKSKTKSILALSDVLPNVLATSDGSNVRIYDLTSLALTHALPGTGRSITAVSWSPHESTVLAIGCVDGSFSLLDTSRPHRRRLGSGAHGGSCRSIVFHVHDANVLATLHKDHISIWKLGTNSPRRICTIPSKRPRFVDLAWHPGSHEYLAATTSSNELRVYDISRAISNEGKGGVIVASDSDDSDSHADNTLDGHSTRIQEVSKLDLEHSVGQLRWINSNLIVVFMGFTSLAVVLEFNNDERSLSRLWQCSLQPTTACVQIQHVHGTPWLVALGRNGLDSHDLPATLLNRLRSTKTGQDLNMTAPSRTGNSAPSDSPVPDKSLKEDRRSSTMKPVSIQSQQSSTSFAKTSRQLQQIRRLSRISAGREKGDAIRKPSVPPQPRSMTSSLELPKPDSEHDSPMPFLSPSIPARGSPQTVIAPLGDSTLELPPLLDSSSFDSSLAPTPVLDDDDDSDDETFVDVLQGSGTFLPGGINVPLPKACGALWAPNGQLLTFFPPRPETSVPQRDALPIDSHPKPIKKGRVSKAASLFPTFGNLIHEVRSFSDDSKSSSGDLDERNDVANFFPDFQLPPSSFHSQNSWLARASPTKPSADAEHAKIKVNIAIHDIEVVSLPFRTQRYLAENYQLLRGEIDSGTAVCEHNATVAETAALIDVALIWRLLALLLEDKVPLEALPGANDDNSILVVAKMASTLRRTGSTIDLATSVIHMGAFGHLSWASSAFDGPWLVRRILEWAELNADVQHLACFAAVLAETGQAERRKKQSAEQSFYKKFPSYAPAYLTDVSAASPVVRPPSHYVPTLRKRTPADLDPVYESPTKQHHKSHTPSRTPSQPTTPYLDSASTTPPFPFPSLSRQGSRLSASGSASPEAHRSSFSTAARYYAQSITDKFASYGTYGTSPPMKRASMSVSPKNNELSTSLPSGSWSKSVSFAASSTAANTTTRGSLLSTSYEEQGFEDPYDSDRTVEDSSLPHTPRSVSGDIIVTQKNQHAFSDEVSGGAKAPLLPDDLAQKSQLWVQYYAEQLRTWGLLVTATELEKIVGTAHVGLSTAPDVEDDGIVPLLKDNVSDVDVCAICTTVLSSTEQICLSCLHTSHLSCLGDYLNTVEHDGFTCPTGCGCRCSELEHVIEEMKPASPTTRPSFRKKLSFTDPRRWRARAEDNNW